MVSELAANLVGVVDLVGCEIVGEDDSMLFLELDGLIARATGVGD